MADVKNIMGVTSTDVKKFELVSVANISKIMGVGFSSSGLNDRAVWGGGIAGSASNIIDYVEFFRINLFLNFL